MEKDGVVEGGEKRRRGDDEAPPAQPLLYGSTKEPLCSAIKRMDWHTEDTKKFAVEFKDDPELMTARQKITAIVIYLRGLALELNLSTTVLEMHNKNRNALGAKFVRAETCSLTDLATLQGVVNLCSAESAKFYAICLQRILGERDYFVAVRELCQIGRQFLSCFQDKGKEYEKYEKSRAWASELMKH